MKWNFGTKNLFHVLQPTLKISERNGTSFQILPGMAQKSGTRSKINGTERTAFQKFRNGPYHWQGLVFAPGIFRDFLGFQDLDPGKRGKMAKNPMLIPNTSHGALAQGSCQSRVQGKKKKKFLTLSNTCRQVGRGSVSENFSDYRVQTRKNSVCFCVCSWPCEVNFCAAFIKAKGLARNPVTCSTSLSSSH